MLKNPDGAVKNCRTATFPGGTFELQRATNNVQSATGGQAGNVGRVKTNGKRGSAVVLLLKMVLTGGSVIFQGMRASNP